MKQLLKVIGTDKQAESTLNTLFEDLYGRAISDPDLLAALRAGSLNTPIIDMTETGIELSYAWIYAHCTAVAEAALYVWAIRKRTTYRWTEFVSSSNEFKFVFLYFSTEYEIRVKAYSRLLLSSPWSATTLKATAAAPVPSAVTGVAITNQSMYVDPVTGETMARVLVAWTNNATSEYVDEYEIVWVEA